MFYFNTAVSPPAMTSLLFLGQRHKTTAISLTPFLMWLPDQSFKTGSGFICPSPAAMGPRASLCSTNSRCTPTPSPNVVTKPQDCNNAFCTYTSAFELCLSYGGLVWPFSSQSKVLLHLHVWLAYEWHYLGPFCFYMCDCICLLLNRPSPLRPFYCRGPIGELGDSRRSLMLLYLTWNVQKWFY